MESTEAAIDEIMRERGEREGRRDQGIAPYAEDAPGNENNIRANDNGAEDFVNENP